MGFYTLHKGVYNTPLTFIIAFIGLIMKWMSDIQVSLFKRRYKCVIIRVFFFDRSICMRRIIL